MDSYRDDSLALPQVSTWSNVDVVPDGSGTTVCEPILGGVCRKYIVRMLGSARKYGLRIHFDLHTIPGSQSGYNHSGTLGQVNVLNVMSMSMGVADAQRAVLHPHHRRIHSAARVHRRHPNVQNHERSARRARSGRTSSHLPTLKRTTIPSITGYGAGNGPLISINDGLDGVGGLPPQLRPHHPRHAHAPYFAFD
ncbi:hypothetical protein B0H10DRAFT_2073241 [Mycena sp. CBHHK59/15]|nr:hypothetical protein B0H10DRAFT_2073241 [Mycena sp. CBHHK59/15]